MVKESKNSKRWLDHARHDLDLAFLINRDGGFSDSVCHFCHQTAEKALKALLLENNILDFPHIHKLSALFEQAKKFSPDLAQLRDAIVLLDKYYIEAKYPMDIPSEYSKDEAKTAIAMVEKVFDFVSSTINKNDRKK